MILLKNFFVNTTEKTDVISIIHEINRTVKESGIPEGLVTVMVPAPGGAVTIIEPLPDIVEKLKEAVQAFPGEGLETKNRRKEEIELAPRIASAMIGRSIQVPFSAGKLVLAPREEIVLVDLERSGKRREFYVQVMGDAPPPQQQQRGAPQKRR